MSSVVINKGLVTPRDHTIILWPWSQKVIIGYNKGTMTCDIRVPITYTIQ